MSGKYRVIEDTHGLVIFQSGTEEYCIDISDVKEILKAADINQTDGSGIKEICEYKIVDTHYLFNLPFPDKHSDRLIIFCNLYTKPAALIVDDVIEFLSLDRLFFEKSVELRRCTDRPFIKWRLQYQNRIIYYPDYEYISKELYHIEYIGLIKLEVK